MNRTRRSARAYAVLRASASWGCRLHRWCALLSVFVVVPPLLRERRVWRAFFLWLATEAAAGTLFPCRFQTKNRLSLLPRNDEGNESCSLRSIRFNPFFILISRMYEPARAAVAVPGKRARHRHQQFLETRMERIERMRKRIVTGLGDGAARLASVASLGGN